MTPPISLYLDGAGHAARCDVPVRDLIIAGWTGRDKAAVDLHIRELAELGVTPPRRTPIFYRVAASLLTTASEVEVIGTDSTGEVEFVLMNHDGELWVGAGSDHTDRKAESIGVTLSKQMCPKPLAPSLWRLDEIEPHWDELVLRSWAVSAAGRALYQEGAVAAMRHPRELIELYRAGSETDFGSGLVMFCGTLPVQNGIRWADTFMIELEDPVLKRKITHSYSCRALPVEG